MDYNFCSLKFPHPLQPLAQLNMKFDFIHECCKISGGKGDGVLWLKHNNNNNKK